LTQVGHRIGVLRELSAALTQSPFAATPLTRSEVIQRQCYGFEDRSSQEVVVTQAE